MIIWERFSIFLSINDKLQIHAPIIIASLSYRYPQFTTELYDFIENKRKLKIFIILVSVKNLNVYKDVLAMVSEQHVNTPV